MLDGAAVCTPLLGFVVSGGFSTTSVKHTTDGLKFEELRPLPVSLRGHCMVALDDESLFVTGGLFNMTEKHSTVSYAYEFNEWHLKLGLSTPRGGMYTIQH